MNNTLPLSIMLLVIMQITACSSFEVSSNSFQNDKELVVLAHGLGRSKLAMWRLEQRLEAANYNVCTLDYKTIGESIDSVLTETSAQIDACLEYSAKAHFVGHSLGGLVIRAYLQNQQESLIKGSVGKVVLMGTPNKGSELADHLVESWIMELGGEITRALVTGDNGLGISLGDDLEMLDVNIGIIAGTSPSSLTKDKFTGPNDGLVSVESTKLNSMSDFIEINVTHTQMRYDLEVAKQVIHFLGQGKFWR